MKQIALTGKRGIGLFALVSDQDFEYLNQFTWNLDINSYPRRSYRVGNRKDNKIRCVQMHRDVAKRSGVFNVNVFHDHIDRNKLNNQRENIRSATRSINGFNRITPVGVSGFRGVKRQTKSNGWQASIGGTKTRIHLGTYSTPEEASAVYQNYVKTKKLVVPDA